MTAAENPTDDLLHYIDRTDRPAEPQDMAPTALDPSQSAHGPFVSDDNSLRLNGMTEAGPTRAPPGARSSGSDARRC
jgi:hypothetical protein